MRVLCLSARVAFCIPAPWVVTPGSQPQARETFLKEHVQGIVEGSTEVT